MQISRRDWENYINALARIDQTAADAMQYWMDDNPDADTDELIYTASLLSDRYGEAAASLACEMYDRTAAAQGVTVPPAEPAPPATYHETAKAVAGTMKNQRNSVPQTVGRLVKQAGADTMLKNAKRDGAEFAWVPHGDTCSFCLMLASNGWVNATESVAKGNHAEHIHPNCDCTFAVRFDGKSGVKGYDPEKYRRMYEDAEGDTWQEKLNSMRRADYAERRDEINAQKRAAYARRSEAKTQLNESNRRSAAYDARNGNRTSIRIPYNDITGKWYPDAVPGSHEVLDADKYVAPDGSVYVVHGNAVVLDYKPHEKEIAELIEREIGGEIYMLPRVNSPAGVKSPDYLFHGVTYDLKTLGENAKENTMFHRAEKSKGQTNNVIFDLTNTHLSDEIIEAQIDKIYWSGETRFIDEIVIIKDMRIIRVFKRNKK